MKPERLQIIIKPLETLLARYGFTMEDNPMVEGPIRMASFVGPNGKTIDYTLESRQ